MSRVMGKYPLYQPAHDKAYNKACVTSKDSDLLVHSSSIGKFLVHSSLDSLEAMEGTCNQRRLISLHECTG